MKRLATALAITSVTVLAPAVPAQADAGYYCGHVNHLHRLQPDIYFIGERNAGDGVHEHRYVYNPLVGNSWSKTRICG